MDIMELEAANNINLVHNRDKWQALVNTVE
jgi:hypothetical protein